MERAEIIERLHRQLPDCGGNLCSHYADQLAVTGIDTTSEDAFSAWQKWLAWEGGKPEAPLTIDASPKFREFHDRSATAIRNVSR